MAIDYQYSKEGVQGTIKLTIPVDDYKKEYEKTYNQYLPKIQLKGFRPGKAPRHLVETRYGDTLKIETIQNVISDQFQEILKKEKISPVSEPAVDFEDKELKMENDLVVTYNFELPPETKLCSLEDISVNDDSFSVTEEDIQKELDSYQKNYSSLEIKDTESQKGDYIALQLIAKDEEGNEVAKFDEKTLIIGDNFLRYDIDDEFIGLKKGDKKEFEHKYKKDFELDSMKGKKINFEITVNEVKERKLPELNDDFAKDYSSFQTIEEWKTEIKNQLEAYAENYTKSHKLTQIYDKIIEKSEFLIPETYIKYGLDNAFQRYKSQFGMKDDVFEKLLSQIGRSTERVKYSFRPSTIKDIKIELIQLELLKQFEVSVSKDDFTNFITEEAQRTKRSEQDIAKEVNSNKQNVEFFLKIRKIEDRLLETVKTEKGKNFTIKDIEEFTEQKNKEADELSKKADEEYVQKFGEGNESEKEHHDHNHEHHHHS